MNTRHFIIATAGHVDHGKSALVRALTGTDPDRLPEEKARGITIDLGFARLTLPDPGHAGRRFELGLVDVPGHEDFVKNMVAGVGSVDVALFVVAADDGWMPQTEEHLQILTYLGLTRAVVALTKIDLDDDEAATLRRIKERLSGSVFADAPVVPTSVVSGRGLDALRAALAEVLATAPAPRDTGKPRLPVDRVFSLRGIGTVVTGTLTGGTLRPEQPVVIQPSGRAAHVRTVQSHGQGVDAAVPGTRTALNLPDLTASGETAVHRGEVVTLAVCGGPGRALDVLLTRSARDADPAAGTLRPDGRLRDGTRVQVHHGSGHWTARVRLLDGKTVVPGGRAVAQLRFESPVFAFAGDRLIVRDGSGRHTLAGGVVLDPDGQGRRFRRPAQRRFLQRRAEADPADADALVTALLERDHVLPAAAPSLTKSPFSAAELIEAATRLVQAGLAAPLAGGTLADPAWWQSGCGRAAELIDAAHAAHPERPGLALDALRGGLRQTLRAPGLFDALVRALTKPGGGFVQAAAAIRRVSHRPALPPKLQAAGERIRRALAAQPLEPPSVKELTPDDVSRQALRFLRDTGEAVEIGPDLVLAAESLQRARAAVGRFIRATGPATASDVRQMLGTTRRVLIPLLEHLDKTGLTRREGDRRALR